jgi:uncharacterized protein (TIGR02145 family)
MKKLLMFVIINLLGLSQVILAQDEPTLEIVVRDQLLDKPIESASISLLRNGIAVATTYTDKNGFGILKLNYAQLIQSEYLPASLSLSDNYPNPFNTETNVELAVPEDQQIHAEIYNILGQRVLSEQVTLSKGYYTLSFNMAHLPSGVYFLRTFGGEASAVKLVKTGRTLQQPTGPTFSVQSSRVQQRYFFEKISGDEYSIVVSKDGYDTQDIMTYMQYRGALNIELQRSRDYSHGISNMSILNNQECVDLIAGQHIKIGEVCVVNDNHLLHILYKTTGGWELKETHVAVSMDEPGTGEWIVNRWQTRQGNPVPGQFPYHNPLLSIHSYTISLDDITNGVGPDDIVFIAAHAIVEFNDESVTAWGDGIRFVNRGNWATYFQYILRETEDENFHILEPGGIVVGVDGVVIGAPEGSLDEEVEIRIEKVEDPTVDIPLPEYIKRDDLVGNFYEFTASDEVIIDDHNYLIIGLPVPEGVSPDNLSIAILMSPEMIIMNGEFDPSMLWTTVRGYYDEESELFGTIVPYVGTIPYTAVLVEGVSYIELEIDDVDNSFELEKLETDQEPLGFHVKCVGFDPGECTIDHRVQTLNALNEIYNIYVLQLGFEEPNLRYLMVDLNIWPPSISIQKRYEYRLEKNNTHNGYYNLMWRMAATQYPAGDSPDDTTTYHELFHSMQFGYSNVSFNQIPMLRSVFGVIEGTAVASEMSLEGLRRSNNARFKSSRFPMAVDVSMFKNTLFSSDCWEMDPHLGIVKNYLPCGSDYRSQDFWVYVGKVMNPHNPQMDFLVPLFEKGGLKHHIDEMLQEDGTFSSLSDAYWQWARNQSFEKSVILGSDHNGNPVPGGDPCALYYSSATPDTINFDPAYWEDYSQDFQLDPLTSKVFQFNFEPDEQAYETETIWLFDSHHSKVKYYYDYEAGTTDCINRADIPSHKFFIDGSVTAYALVSNVHPDEPLHGSLHLSKPDVEGGTVTDRDGNDYKTIKIGDQWWMAENLRTTRYRNGDAIPTGLSNTQWENTTSGAYAIYPHGSVVGINSEAEMVNAYGKLYNWYAVDDNRGLCPEGWHVPTDAEWTVLVDYVVAQGYPNSDIVGGAGNALKSRRQVNSPLGAPWATSEHPRWDFHSTHHGLDIFGFSGLPGGNRNSLGYYVSIGGYGTWWSSTEGSTYEAWYRYLLHYLGNVGRYYYGKQSGFSVRCLRDDRESPYTELPVMKYIRRGPTSQALNGSMYVIGGYYGGYLSHNEEYDFDRGIWSDRALMPTEREFATSVKLNDKIYVISGKLTLSNIPTNKVEVYNPMTNEWESAASLNIARQGALALEFNGNIYIFGGHNSNNQHILEIEKYDPSTDTWTIITNMQNPRSQLNGVVYNGKAYLIGGINYSQGKSTDLVESYDLNTGEWSTNYEKMPEIANGFGISLLNDKIYIFGGHEKSPLIITNKVLSYDLKRDQWSTKTPMPYPRVSMAVSEYNGKIYIAGGYPDTNIVLMYNPETE